MKKRDLANLLSNAAAALESPSALSGKEITNLIDDLLDAARELNNEPEEDR